MTLVLRTMKKHAQLTGLGDHWTDDDYVVLDQDRNVGRIHRELMSSEAKWRGEPEHVAVSGATAAQQR